MLTKLLHCLGFADAAEAIEFILCGLGVLSKSKGDEALPRLIWKY